MNTMSRPQDVMIDAAAEALRAARDLRSPCPPVAARHGLATLADAYRVQEANTVHWLQAGRRLSGRKIGLTSRAVQAQMGVSHPDFGMLYADMALESGAEVRTAGLIQPRVEAEVAFVMEHELVSPDATLSQFLAAVAFALPAIEIVDSAIADWQIGLLDTVADNASSGLYVLGAQPRAVHDLDFELAGMLMTINGAHASLGVTAACLGNPAHAGLWLARKMAEVGRPLAAGDVVLSGALGPMAPVSAGDVVQARIRDLGTVDVRFDIARDRP